jgi:hypothetical protein
MSYPPFKTQLMFLRPPKSPSPLAQATLVSTVFLSSRRLGCINMDVICFLVLPTFTSHVLHFPQIECELPETRSPASCSPKPCRVLNQLWEQQSIWGRETSRGQGS